MVWKKVRMHQDIKILVLTAEINNRQHPEKKLHENKVYLPQWPDLFPHIYCTYAIFKWTASGGHKYTIYWTSEKAKQVFEHLMQATPNKCLIPTDPYPVTQVKPCPLVILFPFPSFPPSAPTFQGYLYFTVLLSHLTCLTVCKADMGSKSIFIDFFVLIVLWMKYFCEGLYYPLQPGFGLEMKVNMEIIL